MRIKSINLRNFRCVRDARIECDSLTALVGPNGAGKSSFLRALEIFYAARPAFDERDFYDNDANEDIEITVTFADLSVAARAQFEPYVQSDELAVTRVLSSRGGSKTSTLHGSRLQNPDFAVVRKATSASAGNDEYRRLRQIPEYADLDNARAYKQALSALSEWEAAHPDHTTMQRDEGQFFGWSEVGQGYLGRFTKLISVPAVRDAMADADEGRGSAITELMDLVVRSTFADRDELQKLRIDTRARYQEIVADTATASLQGLESMLNGTLKTYVPDAEVQLAWMPAEAISIPQPKADLKLSEDRYAATAERTGHGLQRAFILTMLQQLAASTPVTADPLDEQHTAATRDDNDGESNEATSSPPDLILSIEEPELYQHPSRQRHLARVLAQLAGGVIQGISSQAQVIYTTHSPLFVGLDRFRQVRVLRKVDQEADKPRHTTVRSVNGDDVANELWEATQPRPAVPFTWQTLEPRLVSSMTPFMGEGFFAGVAVLVEGEGDRAAILGCAKLLGHDFDSLGISVIPCGGKSNLDRPLVIFRRFGIRCYVVWDGDANDPKSSPADNTRMMRLLGQEGEDYPSTQDQASFACFHGNLERSIKEELGAELFKQVLEECQNEFVFPKKEHALKNPFVISELLQRAGQRGGTYEVLSNIVGRIVERQSSPE